MGKTINFLRLHKGYVAVLAIGLGIGGLLTATVAMAAIPDSSGVIHGCRNDTTTILRVVDSASQSCDGNESSLNWDQNGVKGYAHIINSSGSFSLDTARSKNISSLVMVSDNAAACLTFNGIPHGVMTTPSTNNGAQVAAVIKDTNGWVGYSSAPCSGDANIYLYNGESIPDVSLMIY